MIRLLLASLSLFHYVNAPIVTMREAPTQEAEIASQAYFSEEVKVLEEIEDWIKIETKIDHYQGWIQKGGLCQRETAFLSDPSTVVVKIKRCAAHLYHVEDTTYGPIITLPFDSKLEVLEPREESKSRWIKVLLVDGRQAYVQRGDVTFSSKLLDMDQMCALSSQFLGLPYTWGGRSSFGYDCSGFVQMLYRQMGIYLPRDSKDQIRWNGFINVSLNSLIPGDLIFFGLAEDKIRHVGMYVGKGQFIHSGVNDNLPYICISDLKAPTWDGSGRFVHRAARRLKSLSGDYKF